MTLYRKRIRRVFACVLRSGGDFVSWGDGAFVAASGADYLRIHPHDWARMKREGWVESYPRSPWSWRLTAKGRLAAREARLARNNWKVAA